MQEEGEKTIFDLVSEGSLVIGENDLFAEQENTEENKDKKNDSSLNTENKNPDEELDDTIKEVIDNEEIVEDKTSQENNGSTETSSAENDSSSSPSNPYGLFAKSLVEEGLPFEIKEEEVDSAAKLVSIVKEKFEDNLYSGINKGIEEYKENIPPLVKEILDNYEEGVPLDQLIHIKSRQMELDSVSLKEIKEDEDLQKAVIKEELASNGYNKDEIEQEVDDIIELNKLEDRAEKSYNKLKKKYDLEEKQIIRENTIRQEQYEQERDKQLEILKNDVNSIPNGFIPNVDFTDVMKKKIYDSMTKPVVYTKDKKPLNDLQYKAMKDRTGFEKILHVLNQVGIFDLDKNGKIKSDWSKITTSVKTQAVKDLEKVIDNASNKLKGGSVIVKKEDKETFLDAVKKRTKQ